MNQSLAPAAAAKASPAKKILIFVLLILLILNSFVFQLALVAGQTLFQESYYRDLINSTALPAFLSEALEAEITRQVSDFLPESFAPLAVVAALNVFDEDWTNEQFLVISDHFVDYMKGKVVAFEPKLDLRSKKEELKTAVQFALQMIPQSFLEMFGLELFGADDFDLAENLLNVLPLPDTLEVGQYISEQEAESLADSLKTLKLYRTLATYLPLLIFIVIFLAVRAIAGLPGAFKTFGLSFIISGALLWSALQLGRSFYIEKLALKLAPSFLSDPQIIASLLKHFVDRTTMLPLYFVFAGVLLLLIGGLLHWANAFRAKKSAAQAS